jgi:hypothetical protein
MAKLNEREAFELYTQHIRYAAEAMRSIAHLRKDTRYLILAAAHDDMQKKAAQLFAMSLVKSKGLII